MNKFSPISVKEEESKTEIFMIFESFYDVIGDMRINVIYIGLKLE